MKRFPAETYNEIAKERIDFEFLRNKVKAKHQESVNNFTEKYPHVVKFFADKGTPLSKIREHSAKIIGASALTGTLLFTPPTGLRSLPPISDIVKNLSQNDNFQTALPQKLLVDTLKKALPEKPRALTAQEEKYLEQFMSNVIGVKTNANLDGEHLNQTYGYIGAEQHLIRFPGDGIANHAPFLKEGIAPGLGAWGYFAKSEDKLTPSLVETEKWYAVCQTLYLPDWNTRFRYLRDWYQYRKVLIVNTDNGNAVVAAIADSGPAAWTGKHFGGSPEVMEYLGGPRYKKGPVLFFFVDDPENKVPLGPVDYNKINLPEGSLVEI